MNEDLLAAFDHQGVDPIAQAQAAALLSQQSQIRPPTLQGGAGIAQGRQEYFSPQAPYVNPVTYAEQQQGPSNNQIAQDAFAAARAMQMSGQNAAPSLYEDSSYNQPFIPYAATDRSAVVPRNIVQGQAAKVAQRAGLPREIFQLGQDVRPSPGELARPFWDSAPDTRPLGFEAGGHVYSQPVTMQQLRDDSYAGYVPIHENLHVFEEYLTPEEKQTIYQIMQAFPPPAGGPTEHHPPTTEGIATGLTAYIDNWLGPWNTPGMTGQRPPVPPPAVTNWLRMMVPIVQQRQRSGGIPLGLRP
jgi:hypothetical protein